MDPLFGLTISCVPAQRVKVPQTNTRRTTHFVESWLAFLKNWRYAVIFVVYLLHFKGKFIGLRFIGQIPCINSRIWKHMYGLIHIHFNMHGCRRITYVWWWSLGIIIGRYQVPDTARLSVSPSVCMLKQQQSRQQRKHLAFREYGCMDG